MNNKSKKLIIMFFSFLFIILVLVIVIKGIETKKSNITNMNILNYIPNNYDLTILSNSTNNNIKKYIDENIAEQKRDELNIIKESIISYLGFNLQEKIASIYDNELALTFFKNKLNEFDILFIFKLKTNKDINHIINISEELNKSDQIIELKRPGKLNYISHILKTKDNYIIASSNKELINSSLQLNNNNKIFFKNLIPDDVNIKEIKLLSIAKFIDPKNNKNTEKQATNKIISIISSEDKKIKLRSFSPNINKINIKMINNQIDNIQDIIFTKNYSTYKQNINFLFKNIDEREFIENISQEVDETLLFITNNNNWVLCFKNKFPNKISIDQFNSLKNYKKENYYIKNDNYSIYTNNRLKIKDNNIIYENKNPIFSYNNEVNTYLSNNFDELLNISKNTAISDKYLNNNDMKMYKYILNDIFFLENINNNQITKYYKSLKNLQYFINTELFTLENLIIYINQIIPEQKETVYLESNLKIL